MPQQRGFTHAQYFAPPSGTELQPDEEAPPQQFSTGTFSVADERDFNGV
jgi:hypothetical protein